MTSNHTKPSLYTHHCLKCKCIWCGSDALSQCPNCQYWCESAALKEDNFSIRFIQINHTWKAEILYFNRKITKEWERMPTHSLIAEWIAEVMKVLWAK